MYPTTPTCPWRLFICFFHCFSLGHIFPFISLVHIFHEPKQTSLDYNCWFLFRSYSYRVKTNTIVAITITISTPKSKIRPRQFNTPFIYLISIRYNFLKLFLCYAYFHTASIL